MSSIVGRSVSLVRLHTPAHITGMGNVTNTVSEKHKQAGDTIMTYLEDGNIYLQFKDNEGRTHEAVLFAANIITAELKPK